MSKRNEIIRDSNKNTPTIGKLEEYNTSQKLISIKKICENEKNCTCDMKKIKYYFNKHMIKGALLNDGKKSTTMS